MAYNARYPTTTRYSGMKRKRYSNYSTNYKQPIYSSPYVRTRYGTQLTPQVNTPRVTDLKYMGGSVELGEIAAQKMLALNTNITSGTARSRGTRMSDKVLTKKCFIRARVIPALSDDFDMVRGIRWMVVEDKQPNMGAIITQSVGPILGSTFNGALGFNNLGNKERFTVHHNSWDSYGIGTQAGGLKEIYLKNLNVLTQYDPASSVGTVENMVTGALYLIVHTINNQGGDEAQFNIKVDWRIRYTDE